MLMIISIGRSLYKEIDVSAWNILADHDKLERGFKEFPSQERKQVAKPLVLPEYIQCQDQPTVNTVPLQSLP